MKRIFYGIIFTFISLIICTNLNVSEIKASMIYYDTFVQESDGWKYYDNTGKKAVNAWIYRDGTYYVNELGNLVYGEKEIDGKIYRFDNSGKLANDWLTFSNGKYVMASGSPILNKEFILGSRHFFYDGNGNLISGLRNINGKLYYLDPNGINEEGWRILGGAWRYVNPDGSIATNQFLKLYDGIHYVNEDGIAFYGLKNINSNTYYFDERGVMQSGVYLIGNGWKYFDDNGILAKSKFSTFGGSIHYSNSSGNIVYGLQEISGKNYYFDGTGAMQTGMLLMHNRWCYFDTTGVMKSNEWFDYDGGKYYAQGNGAITYGIATIDGKTYQFDGLGKLIGQGSNGSFVSDGRGIKYKENGIYVKNEFRTIGENRYYFDSEGYRVTGLLNYQGSFFYFNTEGVMQRNVFLDIGGIRFFNNDGIMMRDSWIWLDSGIYHSDANGFIMYGWQTIEGVQYYFDSSGRKLDVYYGVDISEHNGYINWNALKQQNISFAILRASFGDAVGGRADYNFEKNYINGKNNGFKIGVYHYSYAVNTEQARNEAYHILSLIKGKNIDTPIYFDIEDPSQSHLSKNEITAIIDAFCSTIESAGYKAGVYANLNWLNNKINPWVLQNRSVWVAQWNDECTYNGWYDIWQYTNNVLIDGKRFDGNIWYR